MQLRSDQVERLEALQERLVEELLERAEAAELDHGCAEFLAERLALVQQIDAVLGAAYREPDDDDGGADDGEDDDEDDEDDDFDEEAARVVETFSRE